VCLNTRIWYKDRPGSRQSGSWPHPAGVGHQKSRPRLDRPKSPRADMPDPFPTSPLSLSVGARLRLFFGFVCLLRPGVPVPADGDGHRDAVSAQSFISPGRDAHLSSKSCPSLLSFSFVLPLNLLPSLIRVAMARCGPCGSGRC